MMQIMSRNLLELFLKNKPDVILPDMHPVINQNTREVCGIISKKIECDDYNSLEKKYETKKLSKETIEDYQTIIDKNLNRWDYLL